MTTLIVASDILASLAGVGQARAADLAIKASAAAENYCRRPLTLASRDEEYTPGTTRLIRLKGYPVVSLDRICTDLAGVLSIMAIGTPWRATVTLLTSDGTPSGTPDGLTLQAVNSGVLSTATVLFAPLSGPPLVTVSDLAGVVNALGGWTAVVTSGMGLCPLSELRPTSGGLGAVGRPAQLLAYTSTLDDYEINPRTGKITLRQIRPDPYQYPGRTFGAFDPVTKVRVVYTSGYNGDIANGPVTTPPEMAEASVIIAKAILDNRLVSGVFHEVVLGNTSWTAGTPVAIPESAAGFLSKYVDRRI